MNLRAKLLLPTLSISCLLTLFIIVIAVLGYRNLQIQNQARNDLARANGALMISSEIDSLSSIAQVIIAKQSLVNSLELDNQFEVLDLVEEFSDHRALSFVNVYDRYLSLFARSDMPGDFGHKDELLPQLEEASELEREAYFVLPYQNQLTIVYVVPLTSINGFSGVLVVGRHIDESFLNVELGSYKLEMQVSYGDPAWVDESSEGALIKIDKIRKLHNSGVSFFVKVPNQENYSDLLIGFGVILILVVISSGTILFHSYRSLNHISKRIGFISDGVPLLVKGQFPAASDDLREGDEIDSMGVALQEANEAINTYTKDLSRALDDKICANKELEESKNAAIEMAIAKSQFLSNMSHEIRTPMNGVLGLLELIDVGTLGDEDKDLVKTAKQSGKDLIRIINDILIFSKLDVGKDELEIRPFCLKDEIERDVKLLTPAFEERNIYFSVQMNIEDECEWVSGDSTRLGQVVKNLLGNAIKFSPVGGIVHIDVRCCAIDKTHAQLDVNVVDEGIGIASDKLCTVFDSFKQADGSVTRRFGGTGLGLAICQKLVELMGGDIKVESEIDQGSRFYFSIPFKIASAPALDVKEKERAEVTSRFEDSEQYNVLLVEDNQVNVMVAKGLLKKLGFKADVAVNGQEALVALEEKIYQLIFMDCQMPIMDGYEATRQIRDRGLGIPIVAMTANAMPGDREKCLESGMNDYISKPLAIDKVAAVIDEWLFAEYCDIECVQEKKRVGLD